MSRISSALRKEDEKRKSTTKELFGEDIKLSRFSR